MKTYKMISMAALVLALAACTSEETAPSQPEANGKGIPFSATISTGASTRSVTENATDQKLETAWTVDEQVALIHNDVVDVMKVSAIDETTKIATITGSITGSPANGDEVTVVYPASAVDNDTKAVKADLLAAQDGTLATISSDLDLCQSSGAKLKVGADIASLDGTVRLAPQVAIVKFSLSDGSDALAATQFLIKDDGYNVLTTVTPASATSTLYVAMAPATTSVFRFEATNATATYYYDKASATLAAGTYYQSPIKLTDMLHTPLTLEAIEDGTIHVTFDDGLDLAKPITYTKNGVEYSGGTTNFDITVSAGDIVTFHSTNAALGKLVGYSYKHLSIKPTNRCYIYGNIMSLIDDAGDFATDKIIGDKYALYALFSEANKLENDPAKDILLPATTLTEYCYNELFSGCSALTKAPALPATVLKLRCYEHMFWECTSLTEASVMSATTVDDYCCHDMFYKCTNLVKAPELLATTLAQYCYNGMFWGCSKLNYLKCLATDVSADNCLGGWLGEVSATGTLAVASGSTWAVAGTNDIPEGWTVVGIMPFTVSGYSGTYDAQPHGITVTAPEGATVKYGTSAGSCTESTSPTYTAAGNYTVYYEITMDNYDPVTGSAKVEITKAAGSISYGTTNVPKLTTDAAFTNALTKTGDGTVSYQSSDTSVATVNANGEVTIKGVKGTAKITATVADGTNYTYATPTAEYTLTVSLPSTGGGQQDYDVDNTDNW